MTYKGMMFSGLPNVAFTFGYTNASWTLKADLVSEFVCRAAELHGRQRLRHRRARNTLATRSRSCRSWTSPRATSRALDAPAAEVRLDAPRGGSSRTTSSTSG